MNAGDPGRALSSVGHIPPSFKDSPGARRGVGIQRWEGIGEGRRLRRGLTEPEDQLGPALANQLPAAWPTGDGLPTGEAAEVTAVAGRENLAGKWWPQRDSNPCFSLERAASWARLDDGAVRILAGGRARGEEHL